MVSTRLAMLAPQSVDFSSRFSDPVKQLKLSTSTVTQGSRVDRTNPIEPFQIRLNRRSSLTLKLSKLTAHLPGNLLNRSAQSMELSNFNGESGRNTYNLPKSRVYYLQIVRQNGNTGYQLALATERSSAASRATKRQTKRQSVAASGSDRLIRQVLKLTNGYRQQAGLQPLHLNSTLTTAAYGHSLDMATQDFFGHVGSNGSTVFNRLNTAGYRYTTAGENIAAGFTTAKSVVQAWMNSPLHRQNILTPFLEDVGIGFVFLASDSGKLKMRYYWTQDFGVPQDPAS